MSTIILDTETHKLHGEVIQLAYMMLDETKLTAKLEDSFTMNYRPSEAIDYAAMAIHHIINSDLASCLPSSDVFIPQGTEYIIGHNIDYDIDAIKRSLNRCTDDIDVIKRIDTLAIIRFLHPTWESHKLSVCLYRLANEDKISIPVVDLRNWLKKAHDALIDCMLTDILLTYIVQNQNIQSIEQLYQLSEKARIPTHIFYGKYKGRSITSLDEWDIEWILKRTDDKYLSQALNDELNHLMKFIPVDTFMIDSENPF